MKIPRPPRAKRPKDAAPGVFGGGKVNASEAARRAANVRWSPERRTLVQMAQAARPEAFATVVELMRDPAVEPPTRLRAGQLVLAYSDGSPRANISVDVHAPRRLETLSREQLEAIAAGAPPPFALEHQGTVIDVSGELVETGQQVQDLVPLLTDQ